MTIDLDGLVKHAMAKIALTIEKSAGPDDPNDIESINKHKSRIEELSTDVLVTKIMTLGSQK